MSLARVWRRQLYGASGAALVVPAAMLAALVVLALGGAFSQVGVLGQIFAGPPALGAGLLSGGGGGAGGAAARSIPVIPGVAVIRAGRTPGRVIRAGGPGSSGVSNRTGTAGAAPIVTGTPIRSAPPPAPTVPSRPAPTPVSSSPPPPAPGSSPSPQPSPAPTPTAVDQVVTVVTQVTQQLPPPVGAAATQAVQAAGSAADGVLAPSSPGNLP